MVDVLTCPAVKANGDPCSLKHGLNAQTHLCAWHDPDRREARNALQAKGRRNRGKKRPNKISTLEHVTEARDWLWREHVSGRIDKDEATVHLKILSDQEKTLSGSLGSDLKAMKTLLEGLKKELAQ